MHSRQAKKGLDILGKLTLKSGFFSVDIPEAAVRFTF